MIRLALAAILLLVSGAPALAQPPVWVVHGKDGEVTLFGSVHVLPPGVDWEPPALKAALDRADELWFEVPVDDEMQAKAVQEAQSHAFLPRGQGLVRLLSADGVKRLTDFAKAHDVPIDAIDRMQPWYADMLISAASYAGAQSSQGVEAVLAKAAPQARRKAFETVSQQIAIIADAPLTAQLASLEETLKEAGDGQQEYDKLVRAWLRGDETELYRHDVLSLKADSPILFRALITDRNADWTRTLAGRLKDKGHVVAVVGAGHLLGPDGVPARLRALGFKVDGPID